MRDTMSTEDRIYDNHLFAPLVGGYCVLQLDRYKQLMVRVVDYDSSFLLLETPKRKTRFILHKNRIREIQPLTQQEAQAMLGVEVQMND